MSKMLIKSIILTIDKENYAPIIAKQKDTGRYLLFQILNNGVPFALTGKTVRVYGIKKDGSKIFNDLKIIDGPKGVCELQLSSQILYFDGYLKLDLTIYEGNDTLSLIPFTLDIRRSLRSDDALESTNEFSALTLSLTKVDEWNAYFEATSGKIEEKYTVRLNGLSASLEETTIELNTKIDEKVNVIVSNDIPEISNRTEKTFYFKVTKEVSNVNNDLKVSPNMGLKIE